MNRSRIDRAVLAGALMSVMFSLALRVWHRGGNLPGWDYLLATEGQYLLATRGWWEALRDTVVQTRHFWLPPAAYSVPYGLLPGALNLAFPWIFWQPSVVFASTLVALALLLKASGWSTSSPRGASLLLLAWGAWPAGLSYAVQGYPWASCILVYGLAFFVVLHPRVRDSLLWTAIGAALVYELPWHSYELSKTVGSVFLLAVVFERNVRWPVRSLWLLAGVFQIADAYWLHDTANIRAFRRGNVGAGIGIQNALSQIPEGAAQLFQRVLVAHDIALPILTIAGLVSLFLIREHRALLRAVWIVQLGLVVMLSASGADDAGTKLDLLRSRRYLLVETVSILAILIAGRTMRARWGHHALLLLLCLGNVWTLEHMRRFMQDQRPTRFSLPAVESIETVGLVDTRNVAWVDELAKRVKAGERVILLHSQACRSEGVTNPEGTLERLYLSVGHRRFTQQVVAFPKADCRYVCLPLPAAETVRAELAALPTGTIIELDTRCQEKMLAELEALRTHFEVVTLNPRERYARLALNPKETPRPAH